jgi:hypothetical protein
MRTFTIEKSENSPFVYLDEDKGSIEIRGKSTIKNPYWFYNNLLKWIVAFNLGDNKTKVINIQLSAVNNNSVKWLFIILNKISILTGNEKLIINWYFRENSQIEKKGMEYKSNSPYHVNLIAA